MAELFRFVSLRGPAPLAEATLPFVVALQPSGQGPLELSAALDAVVEWAAARGWAVSLKQIDRELERAFDGLNLALIAGGDRRLREPRMLAERVVNEVARGTPEPGAGVADRATVHVLMAEWCARMASLPANDPLITAPAAEQAARTRDFFTRAVLSAPISAQSPMTMTGSVRRSIGKPRGFTTGNDTASLRQALANARAAREAAIAALVKGTYLLVEQMSAAVLAGFGQVVEPMPSGELAMLQVQDLEGILADLDRQIRLLVAQLARAGDYEEGQPYGGPISPTGPRDEGGNTGGAQIAPIRLGVGDLLLAELQSTAYEYGDIAHIENVLAGELRRRTFTKTSTTEIEAFTLTETESTTETDTQSTQRFELEKASQATLSDTLNINAGTSVSASYGPVSAQASFGLGSTTARESSQNQGTKLAQEVVSKASQKVRQLSSTSKRALTRVVVDDSTLHEMNNAGNESDPIVGVYRWVNKLDSLQLMDYGQRLMLGMTIPEPGAYLRWLARTRVNAGGVAPPTVMRGGVAVPLAPDDVTPDNYLTWVGAYSVSDATPPPAMFITQSTGMEHDPSKDQEAPGFTTRTDTTLTVPAGYRAVAARGTAIAYSISILPIFGEIPTVKIAVGPAIYTWDAPNGPNAESASAFVLDLARPGSATAMGAETSSGAKIPIALNIASNYGYAVTIEIVFERSDAGLRTWQFDTWGKIMVAYGTARAAAEDASARGTLPGVTIAGANPLENRAIERTELKRFAIELFAGAVGTLDAMADEAGARPHPDVTKIASLELLTRVFEDAFEWEHMSWNCLDYFWAPEDSWDTLAAISDPDADHKAFLAAGAAKVTIPVRPGYETAVLFRLWTRRIWPGDRAPLPDIPAAVALGAEVATSPKGAPQRGVPVVNGAWVERSPTELVILQPEGTLSWTPPVA